MGLSVKFPSVRTDRDISRLAADVFALPGRLSESAQDPHRRRARRISGDQRIQRRQRRARVARGRSASTQRRLRVRRIRAQPDGADARAETAVLQSRPGDAARENSSRSLFRVHRVEIFENRHQAGSRPRRVDRRSCRQHAVRRAAARPRELGRRARRGQAADWRRRSARRRCTGCWPSRTRCSRPSGSA